MLLKLAIKYLERKGFTIMHQAEGMTTVGYDAHGNKYVFLQKVNRMSKSPEHTLQKQIVGYLRSNGILTVGTDVMSGLMFLGNPKLPSVQKKRMIYINHHKSLGYTAGQPDIVLLLKDGETLLVELKDGNKNKQSQEQEYFEVLAKIRSHNYVVWKKFEDAVDFVKGYRKL